MNLAKGQLGLGTAEERYVRLKENPCPCGKRYTFPNTTKAKEYLAEIHKWYKGDMKVIPTRIYACHVSPGHFHVTSKPQSNAYTKLKRLERELHKEMATVRQNIVKFMEEIYAADNKQYKFSSGPLAEALIKKYPTIAKTTIQAEFSRMRKDGVIVNLGEKVPDAPGGAMYFCLAEHLDKITTPEAKKEEAPKVSASVRPEIKHTSPGAAKPTPSFGPVTTTVPSGSPMDKVLSQLGEILSKVNGLSSGYAQLIEYQKVQREAIQGMRADETSNREDFTAALRQVVAKIDNSEVTLNNEDFESLASAVVKALEAKQPVSQGQGTPVLVSEIADAVNQRLADLKKEDSLIYAIREEIAVAISNINLPSNYASLTDEEKYKLGIKEGIKLAVEMGLILPDA